MALLAVGAWAAAAGSAGASTSVPTIHMTVGGSGGVPAPAGPSSARFAAPASRNPQSRQQIHRESAAAVTVPGTLYNATAGQNGVNYEFTILGSNFVTGGGATTIPVEVIPVTVTFTGTGDVYDPLSVNSSCGESQTALSGTLNSPEFVRRNWYAGHTFLGHTQYTDSDMRASTWYWTNPHGASPDWHMYLSASNPRDASTSVNYPEVETGTCYALGEIDMSYWDSAVQATINNLGPSVIPPNTFPLFLVKNVVLTNPDGHGGTSCCVLGYHSSFTTSSGDTQTYGFADYITDSEFGAEGDVAALSHEIAEWVNDPFVNNPTPAWGHLGQVSGCQSNLEVGDPLTGTVFGVPPVTPNGGPTYHMQELAFFGWFYDDNVGVNGWYSNRGTFTSGASLCS